MPGLQFGLGLLVWLGHRGFNSLGSLLPLFGRNHKRPQSVTSCQAGPPHVRRRSIDENRGDALIFTGIGSLFTAIAAVLLEYPTFATIFEFFSAFALAVALRNAKEGR